MAAPFTVPVPLMGQGILVDQVKQPGNKVKVGDILCHVERGEITGDITSPVAGTFIQWCVGMEGNLTVGANLAIIDVGGGDGGNGSGRMAQQQRPPRDLLSGNMFPSASAGSPLAGLKPLVLPPVPPVSVYPPASTAPSASGYNWPLGLPASSPLTAASVAASYQKQENASPANNKWTDWSSTSAGSATSKQSRSEKAHSEENRESAKVTAAKEEAKAKDDLEKLRCHLHKKANKACKFCQRYQNAKQEFEDELNAKRAIASNKTVAKQSFNCSPLLREQIVSCSYYKSLLSIEKVEDFATEIQRFASDTLDVYRNSVDPSPFMCCVYRLFTLNLSEDEILWIMDNPDSVHVRCVALLYVRFVFQPGELWDKFEEFVLDDAEVPVKDAHGQEATTTIGEYIEDLLLKEKYYSTPLPRIPAAVRRKLEEALAPMSQYRKRTNANRQHFGHARDVSMSVEVFDDGSWRKGLALEVVQRIPSRLKLRVQLDEGREMLAHIGKVLLLDPSRGRSRSRSRGRSERSPDWSRTRGKSDTELIEELRERARVEAVCSDRKDYARRLPRFESGLAIQRDKGAAEAKLIADETFILPGMRRRQESTMDEEEPDRMMRRRTDEEDERQRRMKDIYEKYSIQKKPLEQGAKANDLEGPDTMRLG